LGEGVFAEGVSQEMKNLKKKEVLGNRVIPGGDLNHGRKRGRAIGGKVRKVEIVSRYA